jgi:hypothetical protein
MRGLRLRRGNVRIIAVTAAACVSVVGVAAAHAATRPVKVQFTVSVDAGSGSQ